MGGTHIHHLVWGILLLLICGYAGAVVRPEDPWSHVAVIGFGIGTGLTMDEFALWLNLRDVYWEQEGRRSIDAVIVVAILAALGATGFREWIDAAEEVESEVFAAVGAIGALGVASGLVNAAKEKFGMAALSLRAARRRCRRCLPAGPAVVALGPCVLLPGQARACPRALRLTSRERLLRSANR